MKTGALGIISTSGESKIERTPGDPWKLKKAFQGSKISVSASEQSFRSLNDLISNCIQLLYLGLWSRAETQTRQPIGELTVLPQIS